jgi:hypothetical protein
VQHPESLSVLRTILFSRKYSFFSGLKHGLLDVCIAIEIHRESFVFMTVFIYLSFCTCMCM